MSSPGSTGWLHQLRLFLIAVQFFTRIRIPAWVGYDPEWLHQSARYFPAVGIVVGAVTAFTYLVADWLWPQPVAVLLSTIASIWLTGAFHEDGFADVCDGFGGGMTTDRILEIMKDSRVGAYGAIGIALLLALKCVTLATLPATVVFYALLLAHPLSRLASSTLICLMTYSRAEGKAKPLATRMTGTEMGIACASGLLPIVLLGAFGVFSLLTVFTILCAVAAVTIWMGRFFNRHIGGYTGDCLGAVQQVTEVAIYLAIAASLAHG